MPDQVALSLVLPVVIALGAAVGVLWRRQVVLEREVRRLHAARLDDEQRHGGELLAMHREQLAAIAASSSASTAMAGAMGDLARAVAEQTALLRARHAGYRPQSGAYPATDALDRRGHSHG